MYLPKLNIKSAYPIYSGINFGLITHKLELQLNDLYNKLKNDILFLPCEEVIYKSIGFKMIHTNKDCAGYCDLDNKTIAYKEGGLDTILHEICHVLQANEMEIFKSEFSFNLKFEQQCVSMSYSLMKRLCPSHYFYLDTYFTENDAKFLLNWYGDSVYNDTSLILK